MIIRSNEISNMYIKVDTISRGRNPIDFSLVSHMKIGFVKKKGVSTSYYEINRIRLRIYNTYRHGFVM